MDPNTNRKCERQHEQLIGAHVSYQLEMKDNNQDSNYNKQCVQDDGLPNPPGTPGIAWSRMSGPGDIVFSAPARLDTTATFSAAGRYVLRLTVNDGALIGTSDVTVDVVGGETPPAIGIVPGAVPALGFTTEANRSYTVQARDDLVAGSWSTVQQVAAGVAGRVIQVPLTGTGTLRFFRVVSPATP